VPVPSHESERSCIIYVCWCNRFCLCSLILWFFC